MNHTRIGWLAWGLWGASSALAQTLPFEASDLRPQPMEEIEVRAQRLSDLEQRRYANSVKTVVGRDEIQKYGDTSLEDVLRRQPGVSIPAGGGGPRMRGMQESYTQILIDGQPAGRGFSVDTIAPDQVERLEILRVPTAETGGQAVAGTINIVTREGLARGRRDLGAGLTLGERDLQGFRFGLTQQGGWAGEDTMVSVTVFGQNQDNVVDQVVVFAPDVTPNSGAGQSSRVRSQSDRLGLSLRGQTMRSFSDAGSLTIRPLLFAVQGKTRSRTLVDPWQGEDPLRFAAPFSLEEATQTSDYAFGRVLFLLKRPLPSNLLLETAITPSVYVLQRRANSLAERTDLSSQRRDTDSETQEQSLLATAKVKRFVDSDEQTLGLEFETSWQDDTEATQVDGRFTETGWGGRIDQRRTRWAAFGQWDWNPKGAWAVLGGLRHEEINTVLKTFGGLLRDENRTAQTSPSLSLVYRPIDAPSLLYRWSLSHAYKPTRASDLLSSPRISSRFPVDQMNSLDAPDSVGNPQLKPEQSWGIDFSLERSPAPSSLLSAGVFWKRIIDVQRRVTQLEAVSWSNAARWVTRPRNLGEAELIGVELEARGPAKMWGQWLGPWVGSQPGLELRASWSRYWSHLRDLPGPDNRLPGQPLWEAKLGLDARPAKSALRYGVSLGFTKAARYQVDPRAWADDGDRLSLEAYGVYTLGTNRRLRLSLQDITRSKTETLSTRRFEEGDRLDTERRAGRLRLSLRYEHTL
ncbi:MAG: TonB-dependent receptor [Betaproteobacteria bacterium]|nr:TonB-dependent receptor [Betaproteobacteria bacterium]